jgi:hypothetical protein
VVSTVGGVVPTAGFITGLVETAMKSEPEPGSENTIFAGVVDAVLPEVPKVKYTLPVAPGVPVGDAPRLTLPRLYVTKFSEPG